MLKNIVALRGGVPIPQVMMVVVALTCGACSGGNQNAALNQPSVQQAGQPTVISGPAPMPSMAAMGDQPRISTDTFGSEIPDMPNSNPGSGQMLGKTIPF
jgi:hypothetical protein